MTVTIYRTDGSVLFTSQTATTTAEAVHEIVQEARKRGEAPNLNYAKLNYAKLSHADLSHASLNYADLYGANLTYANLSHANLTYADLNGANLFGANLNYAKLNYAKLSHADLSYANLTNADLYGANLSHADLSYANLTNADLTNADLTNADLYGAKNAPQLLQLSPVDGWTVMLSNTPTGWRVRAGCRDFTLAEARHHWSAKRRTNWGTYAPGHGERMLAAVEALVALATSYGWPEKAPEPEAETAVAS